MSQPCTSQEAILAAEILHRIGADISMVTDREFRIESCEVLHSNERPACAGGVHISFRFGVRSGDWMGHGCLLMPLAEAVAIAGHLMMLSDGQVARKRELDVPDETMKESLLEVGNFIAGAADVALRESLGGGRRVHPEGCQGVRPDVRPALIYSEGESLVVVRASATLEGYGKYDLTLVLPEFGGV
jgi:hypothetical protein